jgi:hypothetical protein
MKMDEAIKPTTDSAESGNRPTERRGAMQAMRGPRRRVFKPNATYVCNREGLIINGEVYSLGDRINPRELSLARLRTMFDAGFIEPL